MNSDYKGYYIGIDKHGNVVRVSEHSSGGSVTLSTMIEDDVVFEHTVEHYRPARGEVIVVFGLHDIEFIHASAEGGASEKQIVENMEAKASVGNS